MLLIELTNLSITQSSEQIECSIALGAVITVDHSNLQMMNSKEFHIVDCRLAVQYKS